MHYQGAKLFLVVHLLICALKFSTRSFDHFPLARVRVAHSTPVVDILNTILLDNQWFAKTRAVLFSDQGCQ